jgi:uncharacterized membrane protein YidH (DUF202 family)
MTEQRSINAIDRACHQSLERSQARRYADQHKERERRLRRWLLFAIAVLLVAVVAFMVVVRYAH